MGELTSLLELSDRFLVATSLFLIAVARLSCFDHPFRVASYTFWFNWPGKVSLMLPSSPLSFRLFAAPALKPPLLSLPRPLTPELLNEDHEPLRLLLALLLLRALDHLPN